MQIGLAVQNVMALLTHLFFPPAALLLGNYNSPVNEADRAKERSPFRAFFYLDMEIKNTNFAGKVKVKPVLSYLRQETWHIPFLDKSRTAELLRFCLHVFNYGIKRSNPTRKRITNFSIYTEVVQCTIVNVYSQTAL